MHLSLHISAALTPTKYGLTSWLCETGEVEIPLLAFFSGSAFGPSKDLSDN